MRVTAGKVFIVGILLMLLGWAVWSTRHVPADCGAVGYGVGGCP